MIHLDTAWIFFSFPEELPLSVASTRLRYHHPHSQPFGNRFLRAKLSVDVDPEIDYGIEFFLLR